MKRNRHFLSLGLIFLVIGLVLAGVWAQDRFSLRVPNGISFSEVKGYENLKFVAPSYRTDKNEIRVILANDTMINAYKSGIPGNGKTFPDGSVIVKIGYSAMKDPNMEDALVPDKLKRVEFIIKNRKRFPSTSGWGYARFLYDSATGKWSPYGKDASFAQECYSCHAGVDKQDYIFTRYPLR